MDRRFTPYPRNKTKKSATSKATKAGSSGSINWTVDEDDTLRRAVFKHGGKKWKAISTLFEQRTPSQCNRRWNELQNRGTSIKKPWSPNEDVRMLELVQTHGASKWAVIASYLPGRNGKQCRERWHNQLNPAIKKCPWTPEEDRIIVEMQSLYGNRWAKITEKLPGRTDNAIKNHWHSSMKSKLKVSGSRAPAFSKKSYGKKRTVKKPSRVVPESPSTSPEQSLTSSTPPTLPCVAKVEPSPWSPESVEMCPTQWTDSETRSSVFTVHSADNDEQFALPQTLIDEVTLSNERVLAHAEDVGNEVVNLLDELNQEELVLSTDTDDSSPCSTFGDEFFYASDELDIGTTDISDDDSDLFLTPSLSDGDDYIADSGHLDLDDADDVIDETLLEVLSEYPLGHAAWTTRGHVDASFHSFLNDCAAPSGLSRMPLSEVFIVNAPMSWPRSDVVAPTPSCALDLDDQLRASDLI